MGVFVKICGCASPDDAHAIAELRPDAVGFILWPGSKRYVKPNAIAEWTRDWPDDLLKVGVFVDEPVERVQAVAETAGLDVVQLHGRESAEDLAALAPRLVWKAVHLNRPLPPDLEKYPADAFLLDYHGDRMLGGTGQQVDWDAARRFVEGTTRKVLLAGGLNRDNVVAAIQAVHPWGVDVSSGVEQAPGQKDLAAVKDFIEQCRSND